MERTPRRQAWPYQQPAWVFSSRELPSLAGADMRFVHGDVRPIHAHMRAAAHGKNLWLVGGGGLVGQFYDAGLLDELIIHIGSVTLGAGKPIAAASDHLAVSPAGVCAALRYGPRGAEG